MRRRSKGEFTLEVPASLAMGFFTPEGERSWVPGWDPVYAQGEPSELPGTVFTTDVHDVSTIWMIADLDRQTSRATYVRVAPGHHAGTVEVQCTDQESGGCVVMVAYDMSLLPGSDSSGLDGYDEASFAAMMDEWADAVRAAMSGEEHRG
ncbi:MAG: hypothetical protein ACR2N7_10970 [Acidimicrobiia bacterium]